MELISTHWRRLFIVVNLRRPIYIVQFMCNIFSKGNVIQKLAYQVKYIRQLTEE